MSKTFNSIHAACSKLILFLIFLTPNVIHAQESAPDIPKFKVDVALVTTNVTVLGTAAAEFHAEDFVVYDNGVAQQLSHFSRDVVPLAVALLIDRSSSIEPHLPLLQKAAISALGRLKAEDPVALFTFSNDLMKLSDLTTDRNRIAGIIGKLTIGYGTDMYDAISGVADYLLKKAPHHRRAIILVSDNCHTVPSRISGDDARINVLESSTTLYSIKIPGEDYALDMRERDPACHDSIVMVQKLADETGGQVLDVEASKSLPQALEKAINNLRLQYTLGFSPSDRGQEGSFHKLTVRFASEDRCPACRLLARSGYYAGSPPAPLANQTHSAPPDSDNLTSYYLILRKIEAAGSIDAELPDIPFAVSTARQNSATGKTQIKIDLQIDFSNVGFNKVGDRLACKIYIGVFSMDEKGRTLNRQVKMLEGTLREEAYGQVSKAGMPASFTIPANKLKQNLKIVLYDEISDAFGSQRADIP